MTKKTERLLLFIIILVFISLRIAFITQKNLWFDEIYSWHLTLGSFHDIIIRTSLDIHPPLYYFMLKLWNFLFGDSVFSMRLLSAIFSSLSLLFIYPICKRVLNPINSLTVIFLFAINPLNIFYSQEARMSAMNLFLNAGSVYFLLKMLDKEQGWKLYFKQQDIYFYVLFRTLALYTHYFSFFIFTAEVILVLLAPRLRVVARIKSSSQQSLPKRDSAKNRLAPPLQVERGMGGEVKLYLANFAAILLLYLPWIPTLIEHLSRGQSWRYGQITHSSFKELLNFIKDFNFGLYYHYTNLNLVHYITIFLVFVNVLSFLSFLFTFRPAYRRVLLSFPRRRESVPSFSPAIPFLLVFVPIFLGIIISFKQRIEFYRYLSIIIPYVLIFIVYGITRINRKYIVVPILLILMLINIFGLTVQYSFDFKNDDYRPLIKQIESDYETGDRIYVEPHYMGWSIDYYKKQWDLKLPNPAYIRYGWNEILDSIKVQKPERFWVVLDYSAVDTINYAGYINGLKKEFREEEKNTYYLAPTKVELYSFRKKEK